MTTKNQNLVYALIHQYTCNNVYILGTFFVVRSRLFEMFAFFYT